MIHVKVFFSVYSWEKKKKIQLKTEKKKNLNMNELVNVIYE